MTAGQAVTLLVVTAYLPCVSPFCSTMNYKNKGVLYNVENITVYYLNFTCADATKPVPQK
jgi:hypothetical protein